MLITLNIKVTTKTQFETLILRQKVLLIKIKYSLKFRIFFYLT